MNQDGVEVHKKRKKQKKNAAIFTEQAWSVKNLLYGFWGKFFLRDTAGSPERVRQLQLARSGSQSQPRILFILTAHGASHIMILGYSNSKKAKQYKQKISPQNHTTKVKILACPG